MTAFFLIVEDDEEFAEVLTALVSAGSADVQVKRVKSRDSAYVALNDDFFDFAILDLKIPTQDGGLDADPKHGKLVFHHARRVAPGTKILVLTGSQSDSFIADMLEHKQDADIWSEGARISTVEFLRKIDIEQAPDKINKVKAAIAALDDIELDVRQINLQTGEDRLIRSFAKRFGARRCVIDAIGEGKSGAKPLRLKLFDANGMPRPQMFAKLGKHSKIQDEDERYDSHVVLLDGVATPRKVDVRLYGGSVISGIFYQLADGFDESLFDVLGADPTRAGTAITSITQCLVKWTEGPAQERKSIGEIRRCWLGDETAVRLWEQFGLGWAAALEAREIQVRWRCVHGDLHGGNVLVAANGAIVLIDYGDVQHSAVSYDPISLELSAVLQTNPTLSQAWPSDALCQQWNDVDAYVLGSPIEPFIRACRSWAEQTAAGRREVAASAYIYLLRQLKYPDTNKDRILALLDGVRTYMRET